MSQVSPEGESPDGRPGPLSPPDTSDRPQRLQRTFLNLFTGFAVTVLVLAGLAVMSMELLSGVRAYVGGESLWSKAQKEAVAELVEYSTSGDSTDWRQYRDALGVIHGDRRAREALQRDPPDRETAREGFRQGGIHPHDIEGMIRLFLWFADVGRIENVVEIWTRGDSLIAELETEAETLRRTVEATPRDTSAIRPLMARVDSLDEELTRTERAFSMELSGAAHTYRTWVSRGIVALSLLLLLFGGIAAWILYRRLRDREEALRRSERRYRRIFRDSQDAIYVSSREGNIEEMNPAGLELLGYSNDELREMEASDLYADPAERTRFRRVIREEGQVRDFEVRLRTKDGQVLDCVLTSTLRWENGEITGYQGIIRDVTERKEFERQLQHRALHDPLTELPNRALFWDRAEQALARLQRRGGKAAILFLDLDRFKSINDSLGHASGDRVLEEVSRRLESAVREPDTVARLGGDEFGILVEEIIGFSDAEEVAERIAETFELPLRVLEQEVHLSASIGIAMIPDGGPEGGPESAAAEPDEYIRRADTAMYRAKEEPGPGHRTFDSAVDAEEASRVQRESDLRRGLHAGEFRLFYQPVVATDTGDLVAVEALLRWEHPERGLLEPEDFLGLAEETGLIRDLGEWMLQESLDQVARWNRGREPEEALRVQPNVSAVELSDGAYLSRVERSLAASELPPEHVMLEVTEHTAMKSGDRIDDLREAGIRVAVDDFGTGYSSLTYVKQLRVDALKVDRSFVIGLPDQVTDRAIVETILTLAHSLEMEVIAEGVETEGQLEWLRSHGCDSVQGFLLAEPLSPDDMEEWLAE